MHYRASRKGKPFTRKDDRMEQQVSKAVVRLPAIRAFLREIPENLLAQLGQVDAREAEQVLRDISAATTRLLGS